jgi:hypothetical protein
MIQGSQYRTRCALQALLVLGCIVLPLLALHSAEQVGPEDFPDPALGGDPAEGPFDGPPEMGPPPFDGPPSFGGPQGFGRGGPGGGPPSGVQERTKVLKQFDKDGDGQLNAQERKAARESLAKQGTQRRGPRFGPRGRNQEQSTPTAGQKVSPADVKPVDGPALYDEKTLRTLFLEFENSDWEKELAAFYHTDVEVAAKLTVDGKTYPGVGVAFHGASSYFMVSEGLKRSLTLSINFTEEDQRLLGYRTLHLLNSHMDPTYVRIVLYQHIAREHIPAPKANFMRVVLNGECWGIYVNQQAFNKDFLKEWFKSAKGARWKVPGSPRGNAGLGYLGEEITPYKKLYELKTQEDTNAWHALIRLCRVLNETAPEKLESALAPMLDIDGVLKFLALDNVVINNDGYWTRASDYNLYLDEKGRFHVIPHDDNETFSLPEGPGMRRGGGSKGIELDPFAGEQDSNKPLLKKLLAVPSLRIRYSQYVRDITEKWLDWKRVGPLVEQYHSLIAAEVKADTRKIDSFEAFTNGVAKDTQQSGGFRGFRGGQISLKSFVEQRRAFLLNTNGLKVAEKKE